MNGSTYTTVTNGTLLAQEGAQMFGIGSVTCRTVKLVITSGFDTQAWELAGFALQGSLTSDPDADGMTDAWEMQHFGGFGRDGRADFDGDGLNDSDEFRESGNPTIADTDGDGQTDGEEWIAGTSITDPVRRFKVEECVAITNAQRLVMRWDTVTGRFYSVYSVTNIIQPLWETNLYRSPGDGSKKSYTNTDTVGRKRYFRLGVSR